MASVGALRTFGAPAPLTFSVRPLQMSYSQKVVIHSKSGAPKSLEQLVEQFITDRVQFIAVAGVNCALIEDLIDEIVVGDGSDDTRFILTSSHPGESLEEVMQFARMMTEGAGEPQLVEL